MLQIFVNDEAQPTENRCETWGELLVGLESQCARGGQVVTAVRFDGVDQPAFRAPALGAHRLDQVATIEVEAVRPAELLLASIDQAVAAIDTLQRSAERIGAAFRGFDVSTANEELAELAGSLGTVVTITSTLSQAMGLNLGDLQCHGGRASQMIDELVGHADALISAQEIGDWITVADIVEYDVAPSLRRWPGLFDVLRAAVPDTSSPAA
jgi:hypothetical protein